MNQKKTTGLKIKRSAIHKSFRNRLEVIVETITNRRCRYCEHNSGALCNSPRYDECVSRIYPVGFKRKRK